MRDFPEITYELCHALDTFYQSRFFYMCSFKNPVQKNVPLTDEMTRVISTSTGISGVSLAYHPKQAWLPIPFIVISKETLVRNV